MILLAWNGDRNRENWCWHGYYWKMFRMTGWSKITRGALHNSVEFFFPCGIKLGIQKLNRVVQCATEPKSRAKSFTSPQFYSLNVFFKICSCKWKQSPKWNSILLAHSDKLDPHYFRNQQLILPLKQLITSVSICFQSYYILYFSKIARKLSFNNPVYCTTCLNTDVHASHLLSKLKLIM